MTFQRHRAVLAQLEASEHPDDKVAARKYKSILDRLAQWKVSSISKHAAPIHPGTGTDQSVHGGGKMTLYRGEGSLDHPSYYTAESGDAGGWWTDDIESARRYAAGVPEGKLYQIEVDESEVERRGLGYFITDPEIRARRQLVKPPKTKTFYHLTDDPNFELRPIVAEQNYLAVSYLDEPGVYITDDPERWVNGYGYVRPFLVELELKGDPSGMGRWGGEEFVRAEDFDQLTIKRVIPLDEYAREHYKDYGWIEGSLDDEAQGVGNIPTFPDYEYTGPDVRDFSPEEVERHKQRAREAWVVRGHGTAEEAQELFKHAAPIHPGTGTDQSVHGSGGGVPSGFVLDAPVAQSAIEFFDVEDQMFSIGPSDISIYQPGPMSAPEIRVRTIGTWEEQNEQLEGLRIFLDSSRGQAISKAAGPIRVSFVDGSEGLNWANGRLHGQYHPGSFDTHKVLIFIGQDLTPRRPAELAETIAHEFGHAVDYVQAADNIKGIYSADVRDPLSGHPLPNLDAGEDWNSPVDQVANTLANWTGLHTNVAEGRRRLSDGEPAYPFSQRINDLWAYPSSTAGGRGNFGQDFRKEFFAQSVENYWIDPKILRDTVRQHNKYARQWAEYGEKYGGQQGTTDNWGVWHRTPMYEVDDNALVDWVEGALGTSTVTKASSLPDDSNWIKVPAHMIVEGWSPTEAQRLLHKVVKHYGPGPHPGTGTPQSIHSGGGASIRPGIDDDPIFTHLAQTLHARAAKAEPAISATIKSVARRTGGKLAGFEFRLKSERSIRDKIFRDLRTATELGLDTTAEKVAASIRDLNRYTITWPADENWVSRHIEALDLLAAEGWEIHDHKYKSAWAPGDHYDGTNLQLTRDGSFIEIQFHTPGSWRIKGRADPLYLAARVLPSDSPERAGMLDEIHDLWNRSRRHVPSDAENIGVRTSFLMKRDNYFYIMADPDGLPLARLIVADNQTVYQLADNGWWVPLSITPAEVAGLGGSADFKIDKLARVIKHYGPGPHPGTGTEQSVHGRSSTPADDAISLAHVEERYAQLRADPSTAPEIRDWALAELTEGREFLSAYVYAEGVTPEDKALEARLGSWVHRLNNLYYTAQNMEAGSVESIDIVTSTPGLPQPTQRDIESVTELRERLFGLTKHAAPIHPGTGTDQSVHGGGQGTLLSTRDIPTATFFDRHPEIDEEDFLGFDSGEGPYDASGWTGWQGSKDIRQAAVEIAGLEDVPGDPHINAPSPGSGWEVARDNPHLYAEYFMDQLVDGQRFPVLYRAVDAPTDEFWGNLAPGTEFDAPLLAFLNVDPRVGVEMDLLDKFGNDLLILQDATGFDSNVGFSYPYWLQSDEDAWLNDLEIEAGDWATSFEDDEDSDFFVEDFREAIKAYRDRPSPMTRQNLQYKLDDMGTEATRFAGDEISEDADSDSYYSWYDEADYEDGYPREVISGGRFEVIEVRQSQDHRYDREITIRQIGVFDPTKEGALITKAAVHLLRGDTFEVSLAARRSRHRLLKHYGPGPHPSGSSQDSHGRRGQQMLDPDMFGTEPPTPQAKLTYTIQGVVTDLPNTLPASTPVSLEDQILLRHAVEDFEDFLPGSLPDNIEFRVTNIDEDGVALAWVFPQEDFGVRNVIFLNEAGFLNNDEIMDAIDIYEEEPSTSSMGRLIGSVDDLHDKMALVKQVGVFHELAHVAGLHQGVTPEAGWPDDLPYYGPEWYPVQVGFGDPSLPSAYAVSNPPEFFAEAITDAWLNGEDAAPLSLETERVFRRMIKGNP